jgi:hypothetical protein
MTTKEQRPLTFVVDSPFPHLRETVTVGELDTVNLPDCAETERVEVILLGSLFDQILNQRFMEAKRRVGKEIEPEFCRRTLGDRFWLDTTQLPRLLKFGSVTTPDQLATDDDLDGQAAELEVRRAEIERERVERQEELRRKLEAKAQEQSAEAREREVARGAQAAEETAREIERAKAS